MLSLQCSVMAAYCGSAWIPASKCQHQQWSRTLHQNLESPLIIISRHCKTWPALTPIVVESGSGQPVNFDRSVMVCALAE